MKGEMEDFSTKFLHYHDFHQVLMIRNGVSLFEDGEGTRPMYGFMAAFIPAGVAHRTIVVGDRVTYQSVYFAKKMFPRKFDRMLLFDTSQLFVALFDFLVREEGRELKEGLTGSCLKAFVDLLKVEMVETSRSIRLPTAGSESAKTVTGYIHRHYAQNIQLSDFRTVLPFTTRHISRLFVDDMKMSVFEYLRLYRMVQASILLSMDRKKRIIDIALDCGYESHSSFFSDFHRHFGMTPAAFRSKTTAMTNHF